MRNLFICGVSLFLGLSIPEYFREYTIRAFHGPAHTNAGWVSSLFYLPGMVNNDFLWLLSWILWFCSSMISLILYFFLPQRLHWLLLCFWTTLLSTRIVPKIGACHGGLSLEHLKEIAEMKSSTLSLSTSTVSSLHPKDSTGKSIISKYKSSCMYLCIFWKQKWFIYF